MSVDIAALRAKLNELKTGRRAQNQDFLKKFYNPPEYDETNQTRSTVRILPGAVDPETEEKGQFFTEALLHKINGKNVHCPKKIGKPCPICDYIRALWATNEEDKIKEARDIKAKKRFYMNVIARERVVQNEKTGKEEIKKNDGPLIYSCGVKVFEKVLRDMVKDDVGDITNLKTGFDFRVEKEMQLSGYPSYDSSGSVRNTSPAGTEEEVSNWMSNLNDLNSLISVKEHNELVYELNLHRGVEAPVETKNEDSSSQPAQNETVVAPKVEVESSDEDDNDNFLAELEKIRKGAKGSK